MDAASLLDVLQRSGFSAAFSKVLTEPHRALDDEVLTRLAGCWPNAPWTIDPVCLITTVREVERRAAPVSVLECGSGLSTLILAALTQRVGCSVLTLEHIRVWVEGMEIALTHFGLPRVVTYAPLHAYSQQVAWYTPNAIPADAKYDVVLCDGPPGNTPGGRSGLVPVINTHLAADAAIVLDDAERPAEAQLIEKWRAELRAKVDVFSGAKGCAVLRVFQ